MKKTFVLAFILISLCTFALADDLPRPVGYVNDFAGIIKSNYKQQIESACASIERSTGVEISVITIKNLDGSTVEDKAMQFLTGWGVGKSGKDNGVVVLVAYEERRMRIETGYGMEGDLPDGLAGEIIRYDIVPRFKQDDYGGGLLAAVYKIGKIAGGDIVAYPKSRRRKPTGSNGIFIVFMIIFFVLSMFGRRRGGGGALGLLWLITGMSIGRSSRGGFSGGSSGGFGGFGGFGGGMGGGGGASGGW